MSMQDTTTNGGNPPFYRKFMLPLIAGGVVLVLLITWFVVNNGVTNKGNKLQNGLNAQYNDNINYLSDCIVRVQGTANIAKAQTDAIGGVLVEVVKGRYDNELAAATPGNSPALISAIVEDYPDMRPFTEVFQQTINVLNGCRTDYRDMQTKMQARINGFEDWRTGSFTARTLGGEFPTDQLRAKKGDQTLRGQAALDQMFNVVVVAEAKQAYETGIIEEPDPFGTQPGG